MFYSYVFELRNSHITSSRNVVVWMGKIQCDVFVSASALAKHPLFCKALAVECFCCWFWFIVSISADLGLLVTQGQDRQYDGFFLKSTTRTLTIRNYFT